VGKATKTASFFTSLTKEYVAEIQLGEERDTDDETGLTVNKADVKVTIGQLQNVLELFKGEIEQVPPIYSAIKIGGKRAYSHARAGNNCSLGSRKVIIYNYQLLDYNNNLVNIRIKCSKGTYIRALARDIGRKLGTYAYMKELVREKIGEFNLNNKKCISNIEDYSKKEIEAKIVSLENALYFMPSIEVNDELKNKIKHGQILNQDMILFPENKNKFKTNDNEVLYKLVDKKKGFSHY
jgi:tRNA pseudouridine55 synthase